LNRVDIGLAEWEPNSLAEPSASFPLEDTRITILLIFSVFPFSFNLGAQAKAFGSSKLIPAPSFVAVRRSLSRDSSVYLLNSFRTSVVLSAQDDATWHLPARSYRLVPVIQAISPGAREKLAGRFADPFLQAKPSVVPERCPKKETFLVKPPFFEWLSNVALF